jgi:hypothetical protein
MNAIISMADLTAEIIQETDSTSRQGVELLYTPAESIFAAAANGMWENGWSVLPQNQDRKPGSVYGEMIRWGPDGLDLSNVRADPAIRTRWTLHCATLNVACVFGPASGNTFAVDIDVLDESISAEIVALTNDLLGYTPLRREGMAPKLALIYRHAPDDVLASRSRWLAAPDDSASEHGIEILGRGKVLTFHGRHHKTGCYYKWLDQNPQVVGPDAAPLVTSADVEGLLKAIEGLHGFAQHGRSSARMLRIAGATWAPGGADKRPEGGRRPRAELVPYH